MGLARVGVEAGKCLCRGRATIEGRVSLLGEMKEEMYMNAVGEWEWGEPPCEGRGVSSGQT